MSEPCGWRDLQGFSLAGEGLQCSRIADVSFMDDDVVCLPPAAQVWSPGRHFHLDQHDENPRDRATRSPARHPALPPLAGWYHQVGDAGSRSAVPYS